MNEWIYLLNGAAVSLFGSVLAASFCGALNTRRHRLIFWISALLLPLLQGAVYLLWDSESVRYLYPFLTHLPLWLVLFGLTKQWLWSAVSLLSAYLCCELRRWFALFVVAICGGSTQLQALLELLFTLPLLWLLLRFVAPVFRKLAHHPLKLKIQFGIVPTIYYGFDYLTRIYTDLLSNGTPVAVEFMPFVCCSAYLSFLLYNAATEQAHERLRAINESLDVQLTQSAREISALRESQALTRRYRHDLRHHLQYLSVRLENGQLEQAQAYIAEICEAMEAQTVQNFCENEVANLILSAFDGRAKQAGVTMRVQGYCPARVAIADSDLCVLFSNALENALHACQALTDDSTRLIDVQFYSKDNKLFLQITNPCDAVRFEEGLPVTEQPDHGIGVQSICAIVQRYGGLYSFSVQDGLFILRLSL